MFNFKPAGFSIQKMLKKAGKVGGTVASAGVLASFVPEDATPVAAEVVSAIGVTDSLWAGLFTAVLAAAANYLRQATKKA